MNLLTNFTGSLKSEFKGYNKSSFVKDLMSGITVAAVALPLALAFGVSSGATAAAGLFIKQKCHLFCNKITFFA